MIDAHEKKMLRILSRKLVGNPDAVPRCGDLPIWDINKTDSSFRRHVFKFVLSELTSLEIRTWDEEHEKEIPDWVRTVSGSSLPPYDLSVDDFYKITGGRWTISRRQNMESLEDHTIMFREACESYDKLVQANVMLSIVYDDEFGWYWLFVHPSVL